MYLTLEQIKHHLNLDYYFIEDDQYLMDLARVVENAVQKHIDTPLSDLEEDYTLPAPLIHAMLLLIGTYYAKRESIVFASAQAVPQAYDYLLDLYKNYNGPHEGTPNF